MDHRRARGAAFWVGVVGAVFFLFLAGQAVRDARSLWERDAPEPAVGWAFWKGVANCRPECVIICCFAIG
jgi:threonine/homoserine/homoserine lactone efflux protein